MDLSALLKGRTSAGLSSQVPGGKSGSPKKAPVSVSAAGRPASILGSVADEPESDVEEDPFAEFTVMDGLEDLDEMLTDKDGAGPHPNVSHGQEPSESLATGVAASVQPAFSDAIQSNEPLDSADQATQRSPLNQADDSTQVAGGAMHGQPCPELSDDALPGVEQCRQPAEQHIEALSESASKAPHSTMNAVSTDKPGHPALEAADASGSSSARLHTERNHTTDCEEPALRCRPAVAQIPQQPPQDTVCHDEEMTVRDEMPTQAAVDTATPHLTRSSTASLPQAPDCQFAAMNAASDGHVPDQHIPVDPADTCQPKAFTGTDVAQASVQKVSSPFTMQANLVNLERQSQHEARPAEHMDVPQDRSEQQVNVCLDSISGPSAMDSDQKDCLALNTSLGETYCLSDTAADTVTGSPANKSVQHTDSVSNGNAQPPKTQAHARSPRPSFCPNSLSTESVGGCAIATGSGAEDHSELGHRPMEVERQDRMDNSDTGHMDQQLQATDEDMNNGDLVQDPVPQLDEGGCDVPVSIATRDSSVDSRAALLSSFWDTMSTDHAPEGADDGSDLGAPAHAGQCVNSPSKDISYHTNTAHHGQVSPPMSVQDAEPAIKTKLCSQDPKHGDTSDSVGKSPTLSSTPRLEIPHRPETRPSLHLRMASLSPTLASSPGLRLKAPSAMSDAALADVPASFAMPPDEEQMMDTDAIPLTAADTAHQSNTCNTTVQEERGDFSPGRKGQILAEHPVAANPVLNGHVETTGVEACKATHLESVGQQNIVVNATGTEPDPDNPEHTAGLESHPSSEAREPAQSCVARNSCMRPVHGLEPLVDASGSQTSAALHSPLSSSHVQPACPQPAAQGNSIHLLPESETDVAVLSPTVTPQGHSVVPSCLPSTQTPPTARESGQLHPKAAKCTSTGEQVEASRQVPHAGYLGSTRTNAAAQEESALVCAGSSQVNRDRSQAMVLRPIHNIMDHIQAESQVNNMAELNQTPQSLTSGGQRQEMIASMAAKRKLAEVSVPMAAAKERRVDITTNCEATTGRPPHSPASMLTPDGDRQTAAPEHVLVQGARALLASACDNVPGAQEVQHMGDADYSCATTDSAPCGEVAAAPVSTQNNSGLMVPSDSATNIPDYRKALAELSASLQEATISVDETTDQAAEVRVQSAVLNHRWASMLQPAMFGSPEKSLSECYQNLESVAAACREAMAIAMSQGWMDTDRMGSVPTSIDSKLMEGTARPCGKPFQEQRAL